MYGTKREIKIAVKVLCTPPTDETIDTVAIYTAYSDESDVGDTIGTFIMGGYLAPEQDWRELTESWRNRVLNGPPTIPYLHMREIRREEWRSQHGISFNDAEDRITEAVRIIFSRGSLSAIASHMRRDHLTELVHDPLRAAQVKGEFFGIRDPDYLCFLAYAVFVLAQAKKRYRDVDTVNFVVSRKRKVSEHIADFHKMMKKRLSTHPLWSPLKDIVGDLSIGDMEVCPPLQFPDVLCWHMQRYFAKTMNRTDENRLWYLGETPGHLHENDREDLQQIAEGLLERTTND